MKAARPAVQNRTAFSRPKCLFREEVTEDAMQHNATAANDDVPGTLAIVGGLSATMLLGRDYAWCAETMLTTFGTDALGRAERRAQELLRDDNPAGYEIWIKVAATIRKTQISIQAAECC